MFAWLLTAAVLLAEPQLNVETAAQIERDQQKATAEVAKKFGNKKPSELTPEERRDMIRAEADAQQKVLDKHGVDGKSWSRYSQTQNRADYAAQKEQVKALVEKEKQAEAAAAAQAEKAKKSADPADIPIQRGFSDEKPVTLEENKDGTPVVERELPADARADEEAAKDADSAERGGTGDKAPDKKAGSKRGKHR